MGKKEKCSKTVGIVWHGHFPWNRGIGSLAKTLHKEGWQVILLTRNLSNEPSVEELDYAEIRRVPANGKCLLARLLYYHFPLSPGWFYFLHKEVKKKNISLLIVRDLPLALVGGIIAKLMKIPAAMDMREHYPSFIASASNKKGVRRFVRSRRLTLLLQNMSLPFFKRVFVPVAEMKSKISPYFNSEKIDVFCYLPDKKAALERKYEKNKKTLKFIYSGGLEPIRGLGSVLDAFALIDHELATLTFIASPGDERILLEKQAISLGLNNVEFHDLFPHDKLQSELKKFDIGIINHLSSPHIETTVPMKLFEYMASGLAVAVSPILPIERVVKEANCGLVFKSHAPEEIAKIFQTFIDDKMLVEKLGSNGRRAVLNQYNWKLESKKLITAINDL